MWEFHSVQVQMVRPISQNAVSLSRELGSLKTGSTPPRPEKALYTTCHAKRSFQFPVHVGFVRIGVRKRDMFDFDRSLIRNYKHWRRAPPWVTLCETALMIEE